MMEWLLAQSILEYIHDEIGAKTMFSTHYHELTALDKDLKHLKNVHVSAIEEDGKITFLHKVKSGSCRQELWYTCGRTSGTS